MYFFLGFLTLKGCDLKWCPRTLSSGSSCLLAPALPRLLLPLLWCSWCWCFSLLLCVPSSPLHSASHFLLSVPLYMPAVSLQSCPTLCNPVDCKPTRRLCPWSSPGKNAGVGGHALSLPGPGIKSASPALQADPLRLSRQGSLSVPQLPLKCTALIILLFLLY